MQYAIDEVRCKYTEACTKTRLGQCATSGITLICKCTSKQHYKWEVINRLESVGATMRPVTDLVAEFDGIAFIKNSR